MPVEISEYQGKPVIALREKPEDQYPFSFGYKKAKMILENIEAIKEFLSKCESEKATKGNK